MLKSIFSYHKSSWTVDGRNPTNGLNQNQLEKNQTFVFSNYASTYHLKNEPGHVGSFK